MRQVDTPQFKKWFAGSKVVDAQGNPLVVYHATTRNFAAFDPDKGEGGFGCHFGTLGQAEDVYVDGLMQGIHIIPCFLRIKNPIRLRDFGTWDDYSVSYQLYHYYRNEFPEIVRTRNGEYEETVHSKIDLIKKAGYDGVVYLNSHEGVPRESSVGKDLRDYYTYEYAYGIDDNKFMDVFPEASMSFIAFDPGQIKAAYGNKNYDPKKNEYGEALARKVIDLCR